MAGAIIIMEVIPVKNAPPRVQTMMTMPPWCTPVEDTFVCSNLRVMSKPMSPTIEITVGEVMKMAMVMVMVMEPIAEMEGSLAQKKRLNVIILKKL